MARHLRIVKQPQKLPVVLTADEMLLLLESAAIVVITSAETLNSRSQTTALFLYLELTSLPCRIRPPRRGPWRIKVAGGMSSTKLFGLSTEFIHRQKDEPIEKHLQAGD